MKFALALLCLTIAIQVRAQQVVRGLVLEEGKSTPLPYANVYLEANPSKGTVTNNEGYFSIQFNSPPPYRIVISYMGFDKKIILVNNDNINQLVKVRLKENRKILKEVVVMPDDAMKTLLSKAFNNINTNYPQTGKLSRGFYRETNQTVPEEKFLYFSEAVLEYYQPSYRNNHFGPVKIVRGGKAELKSRSNYSKTIFYAGPYISQRLDFVKQREEFINPRDYDLYDYTLVSETKNDGHDVYEISFTPKQKASYQGTFFLDKETLAYIEAQYELSSYGLQKNQSSLTAFEFKKRTFIVKYKNMSNVWNLYAAIQDGVGEEKNGKNKIRYTNEYVMSSIESSDENPISDTESIPYSEVYTRLENKFSENYWKDSSDYVRPKKLDSTVNLMFNNDVRVKAQNDIKSENDSIVIASERKTKFSFLSKISSAFYIGVAPVSVNSGLYQLSYYNYFSTNRSLPKNDFIPIYGYDLFFHPSRYLILSFSQSNNLSSAMRFSNTSLNIKWNFHIAGWRRSFYLQPAIGVYTIKSYPILGNHVAAESFSINGRTIRTSQIQAGIGEQRFGITPSLQMIYRFKPTLGLFCEVSSSIKSWSTEKIIINEATGFFLTRRSASASLATEGIRLSKNSIEQKTTGTQLRDFGLFGNVGIKIGIK